jgi:hypothetical protein
MGTTAHAATTAANTEAKGLLILHPSIFVRDYYTEAEEIIGNGQIDFI